MIPASTLMRSDHHICIIAFSPIASDARVLRQARALAPHYRVTLIGFGEDPFKDNPLEGLRWIELENRWTITPAQERLQRWCLRLGKYFPRLFEVYYKQFPYSRYAWHLVQSAKYKVILCNDVDTLPLGVTATRVMGAKIILDLHEYATREYDNPEWRRTRYPLVHGILKTQSKLAKATITVTESFVKPFREEFGMKKPIVIYSAPDKITLPPRTPSTDGKVHLIHHGIASSLRSIELMILAVAMADKKFVLHFMLTGNDEAYKEFLRAEAARLAPGRIFFETPVKPAEIVARISQYDAGIFLLPPVVFNYKHAMPNKLFDFISAGLGVIISPSPAMSDFVKPHGNAWIAEDFTAEAMTRLLNSITPEELATRRAASLKCREIVNSETEMAKLLALVKKLAPEKIKPLPMKN